jgi:hypothetical protein
MSAPLDQLTYISAPALFLAAGFAAAAGWPLPDGTLPVGGAGLGGVMHLMVAKEWQAYRDLCAGERLAQVGH